MLLGRTNSNQAKRLEYLNSLSDQPALSKPQAGWLIETALRDEKQEIRKLAADLLIRMTPNHSWRIFAKMAATPVGEKFESITVSQQDVASSLRLLGKLAEADLDRNCNMGRVLFVGQIFIDVGRSSMKNIIDDAGQCERIENYEARYFALSLLSHLNESMGVAAASADKQGTLIGSDAEYLKDAREVIEDANRVYLENDPYTVAAMRIRIDQLHAASRELNLDDLDIRIAFSTILNQLLLADARLAIQASRV